MIIDEKAADILWRNHRIRFFPKLRSPQKVRWGDNLFETHSQHPPAQFMPLGAYSYSQSYFDHVESIGRYCSIGLGIQVMGDAHPVDWISSSPAFYRPKRARFLQSQRKTFPAFSPVGAKITIGHDVWIGDDVLLAHGVRLGTGCIVAARSVVTRDVPPYAIVAGVPAKTVRYRFPDETIERLLASQWWQWPISAWDDIDPRSIDTFLEHNQQIGETTDQLNEDRISARTVLSGI